MESYMMPGFRFYPTEEELVSFYLQKKIQGRRQDLNKVIPELYIYEFNPWDLPQFAGEHCPKDLEQWFFFIPRQEKEARGGRPNRLTTSGFWKATGSPGYVFSSDKRIIGAKRTMVFYNGRAPTGVKTEWKMNEYTAIDGESASSSLSATLKLREEFSLCRVYIRSKCLRAFDRRPSSSAAVVTSAAMVNQANDHHNAGNHDSAVTTHQNNHQNNHPTMDHNPNQDGAATSYLESQINDYAILNSQTFNQGLDHNPSQVWAATTYLEYQNDNATMETMIPAPLDQRSWHHENINALASAGDHPNSDMGFDNNEDLFDFWDQLNFLF